VKTDSHPEPERGTHAMHPTRPSSHARSHPVSVFVEGAARHRGAASGLLNTVSVAWNAKHLSLAHDLRVPPPAPRERRRRGRPPIHLSASLNLVMPSQLFPEFPGEASMQAEKRLLLAVLEDAIDILLKHAGAETARGQRLYAETVAWIVSEETGSPFDFLTVCEALDLSPSCLRRGLERLLRLRARSAER